jgi:hypothetical protein
MQSRILGQRIKASTYFFDKKLVKGLLTDTTRKALSKAGAFVQRTAKLSLSRTGKKPSKPGTPPRKRVGLLRDQVFFVFDPDTFSVVVGPRRLNMVAMSPLKRGGFQKTAGNVPGLHEFGGKQGIIERKFKSEGPEGWRRADLRRNRDSETYDYRLRVARYPARPYMGPALRRNLSKFPKLYFNQFGKR